MCLIITYFYQLQSTADKGKANKELIKFLSVELKISKSEIFIVRGEKCREKIVEIDEIAWSNYLKSHNK